MSQADYWNQVYRKGEYNQGAIPTEGSTFARSVLEIIPKEGPTIEFGCGNGRDAFFFCENGCKQYHATDIADLSIAKLQEKASNYPAEVLKFTKADFTNIGDQFGSTKFACVYSRFTIHSIKASDASRAYKWAYDNMSTGGIFLIEVRSVLDPMCGKGQPVEGEKDAYINTHYRRFVRKAELLSELEKLGFHIKFVQEENNLAVYKQDNPVVIRVHAVKK